MTVDMLEADVEKVAAQSDLMNFSFNRRALAALAETYGPAFRTAEPFPYVSIPDFLPLDLALALSKAFPGVDDIEWRLAGPGDSIHTKDKNIEKLSTANEELFPPLVRKIMHEFNSGVFLDFIQALTGFQSLAPDPWYHGCGLHSTGRGGRLMIHADASRHPNPKFQQILNMIYYVTPEWQDEWGGKLELWDREAKACVNTVTPQFNSAVIFFTGSKSYHGHPHPLQTPAGVRRNSMAVYFYTTDRPTDETYDGYKNFVEWKRTNELDRKTTLYHQGKALARRALPKSIVNGLASTVRSLKR